MFVETSAKKIPVSSGRAASRCTMSAAFSFGPISLLTELTHVIYADIYKCQATTARAQLQKRSTLNGITTEAALHGQPLFTTPFPRA